MPEPVVLKSTSMGIIMKFILWLSLATAAVIFALAVSMLLTRDTSGAAYSIAMMALGFFALGWLPLMAMIIIWVVMFHLDLKRVFPDYPMSPLRAILYMFIPLFNLFGLWRTFASISEYLRASGGESGQLGDRANLWSTMGYLSIFVGNIAYYFANDISLNPGVGKGMDPLVFLALALASTVFVLCYLISIQYSQKSLALVALKGQALDTREVLTYVR